jgi:hypothetical protein
VHLKSSYFLVNIESFTIDIVNWITSKSIYLLSTQPLLRSNCEISSTSLRADTIISQTILSTLPSLRLLLWLKK